jgi:hypothetical protein
VLTACVLRRIPEEGHQVLTWDAISLALCHAGLESTLRRNQIQRCNRRTSAKPLLAGIEEDGGARSGPRPRRPCQGRLARASVEGDARRLSDALEWLDSYRGARGGRCLGV